MHITCLCSILVGGVDWCCVESFRGIWVSLGLPHIGSILGHYNPRSLRGGEGASTTLIAADEGIPGSSQDRAQGATIRHPHCHCHGWGRRWWLCRNCNCQQQRLSQVLNYSDDEVQASSLPRLLMRLELMFIGWLENKYSLTTFGLSSILPSPEVVPSVLLRLLRLPLQHLVVTSSLPLCTPSPKIPRACICRGIRFLALHLYRTLFLRRRADYIHSLARHSWVFTLQLASKRYTFPLDRLSASPSC